MKRPLIAFFLLCSFWGTKTQAQYTFSVSTAPYLNLSSGTSVQTLTSADAIIVPGLQIEIDGIKNDTVFLRVPFGRLNSKMPNATAASFFPFDAEQTGGKQEYTVSGTQGNRILKLQFKSIKFSHDWTSQDSMNYQVWFFESDNSIEVHFGPSSVLCPQSYFVVGGGTMNGPTIGFNGLWLSGNPSAPTTTAVAGTTLNGTPPNGTVYSFKPLSTGVKTMRRITANPLISFPNPATNELYFAEIDSELDFIITDITGKAVLNGHSNSNKIDITSLYKGAYWVSLFSDSKPVGTCRFIKN